MWVGEVGMIREYIIKISDEIIEEEIPGTPPELIRCKDCKHQNEYRTGSCPFYTTWGSIAPDDWFCADGKRW